MKILGYDVLAFHALDESHWLMYWDGQTLWLYDEVAYDNMNDTWHWQMENGELWGYTSKEGWILSGS